jgi:hypothetical protein
MWSSRWNAWQERPKYSEETCPNATLSTTNPTCPDPGSKPGLLSGKLDSKTQEFKFDVKELPVLFNMSPSSWWYGPILAFAHFIVKHWMKRLFHASSGT